MLRQQGLGQPSLLMVSGVNAPQMEQTAPIIHKLPDDEFAQVIRSYKGIPKAIAENEELFELLLPRLRSDIKIGETYTYEDEEPLSCRIIALYSTKDSLVSRVGMYSWKEQTKGGFKLYSFPGDHFFLHSAEDSVLDKICTELKQYLKLNHARP